MSITRLQQARQMYAMGQRVAKTLDGSRPGYRGRTDANTMSGSGYGAGSSSGGDGGDGRPNMADIAGPVTGPVDMSQFGDTGDIVQADFTPYNQRPDTITSFGDNYAAQRKAMGLLNFFPGAQIYNIGKTALQTNKARNLLGFGPTVGPSFTGGDGDNGIMNLYTPNMLDVAEEDQTIETDNGEMQDFIQRFRGFNKTRQDKEGQLDPAIMEMISKLYT